MLEGPLRQHTSRTNNSTLFEAGFWMDILGNQTQEIVPLTRPMLQLRAVDITLVHHLVKTFLAQRFSTP